MKRILFSLLALTLTLSMLLASCNKAPSDAPSDDKGDSQPPSTEVTPYDRTDRYMPADIFAQMKTYLEGGEAGFFPFENRANAPFVSTDMYTLSNCRVKSITIPVYSTGAADTDGNFTFSLYVLSNDWATLKEDLKELSSYPILVKINAREHGLEENATDIRKFITVDLTPYAIKLSATETLGFSHKDDTLTPARVLTSGTMTVGETKVKYPPAKYMIDNWDVVGYYYHDRDDDAFTYSDHSLLFDFELERTYESEASYNAMIAAQEQEDAEYAAMIAALKAAYAGKTISVMGDSISTFNTITNDPALGLGDNPTYSKYTLGATIYTYERTYWGKLASLTGMELGVINSWGAGKVYGNSTYQCKDNMLLRSYNLARNGKAPDLILLNYGINDMSGSYSSAQDTSSSRYTGNLSTGNLYQRLTATNKTKTDKEIVGEWFAEVKAEAERYGFKWDDPNTITFTSSYKSNIYTCWEAAYALSLYNIQRLYPDAEIVCITLPDRNHSSSTQPRLTRANLLIKALAEYFETGFVDQAESGINRANCLMYGSDGTGLHPNGKGHAALTKVIAKALYAKLPKS